MNNITLSVTITVPQGMTQAEILRLFTDHHNYQDTILDENGIPNPNPQTRSQFAKATVARQIAEALKAQRRIEAEKALIIGDITVE